MTTYHPLSVELEPDSDRPTVVATAEWSGGRVWGLTVACPFIGVQKHWRKPHQHHHGGGSDPRRIYLGHRVPDCDTPDNRGYNLTLAPGSVTGPETK